MGVVMFGVLWVVESVWCRAVRVVSCRPPDADNPLQTDRDTRRDVPFLRGARSGASAVALQGDTLRLVGTPVFCRAPTARLCEDFFLHFFFFRGGSSGLGVVGAVVRCVRGKRGLVRCWLGGAVPLGEMGAC